MRIATGNENEHDLHSRSQLPPNVDVNLTIVTPLFGTTTVSFTGGFLTFLKRE